MPPSKIIVPQWLIQGPLCRSVLSIVVANCLIAAPAARAGFPGTSIPRSAATQPASAPATQAAKPDYYAMTATDFFKLSQLQNHFKETRTFSQVDRDLLEAAIFHATNQARAEQKMPPLAYGNPMLEVARQHSDEMVLLQYIEHESPVPAFHTVTDRFTRAGLHPHFYSENIAMLPTLDAPPEFDLQTAPDGITRRINRQTGKEIQTFTYDAFAHACVKAWMESPHHRANILSPNARSMAVGLTVGLYDKQDSILVTQNFSSDPK